MVSTGNAKCGVFVRLKNSARNCNRVRSVTGKDFKRPRSKFLYLGPRIIFLPALPSFPDAGAANAPGSNHRSGVRCESGRFGSLMTSGRIGPPTGEFLFTTTVPGTP